MDPAAALLLLSMQPVRIDPQAALLPGALLPVVLPIDGLPAPTRAAWLIDADRVEAGTRVAALLEAGRDADAFHLLGILDLPATGGIAKALEPWIVRERERLALPDGAGAVLPLDTTTDTALVRETKAALEAVTTLLPLAWPRWAGPLVVMGADPAKDPMPGRTWLARPALPILRCTEASRSRIATDLTGLALALSCPPTQGWPVWLRRGLAELAARRALGQPPGPQELRRLRQDAGSAGLRDLLMSVQPGTDLALAVCVPLVQPEHRARFKALLDLLRNGGGSEGALHLAYGWSLADLATLR